jgi:hypothetical protein
MARTEAEVPVVREKVGKTSGEIRLTQLASCAG